MGWYFDENEILQTDLIVLFYEVDLYEESDHLHGMVKQKIFQHIFEQKIEFLFELMIQLIELI